MGLKRNYNLANYGKKITQTHLYNSAAPIYIIDPLQLRLAALKERDMTDRSELETATTRPQVERVSFWSVVNKGKREKKESPHVILKASHEVKQISTPLWRGIQRVAVIEWRDR